MGLRKYYYSLISGFPFEDKCTSSSSSRMDAGISEMEGTKKFWK